MREAVAEDLAEGYRDMDARELARLSEVGNHLTVCQKKKEITLLLIQDL